MRIKLLLSFFLVFFCFSFFSSGQTVIWSEDFGTPPTGTPANGYTTGNGTWTVSNTGTNGADANVWYVSGAECGNAAGACGSACNNGDASLHLGPSATFGGDAGAAYAAGGLGFFFIETNKRAESPVINLTGQTGMTLTFNYIEDIVGQAGQDPGDEAQLWYFDGAIWSMLDPLAITPAGCNPQGTWTAFSIAMPASANNNANVKIGFTWTNDDDNVGTDPSFAVDDIQITIPTTGTPPSADFSASLTTICAGDCIDFTDLSTSTASGGITAWDWTFNGAATSTSNAQNPTNICYNTAGIYDVVLTVTDANGNDTETKTGYITVTNCSNPTADFSASLTTICEGDCIDFTDLSTSTASGGITAWDWTFNGAATSTSNAQNPTNICYNTSGVYDVVLTVTDANGNDTETKTGYITVVAPPNAGSDQSANLCNNQSLDLNTVLSGADAGGSWVETSGTPSGQFNSTTGVLDGNGLSGGSIYTFSYTVSNGSCPDDVAIITITIDNCNTPVASFTGSSLVICEGDCIDFTSTSTSQASGGITAWNWTFNGANTGTSSLENPTSICYNTAGTYSVSLTVTDANGSDTHTETNYITVQACQNPQAAFSFDTVICVGDCINFTDQSTGNPTSWGWQFGGASPSTSSQQNPSNICFFSPGVWTISLTVTNTNGSSTTTQDITVYPEPFVIANPDQTIIIGTDASLSATGDPGDFSWSPATDVACPTCQNTSASPVQYTVYYVTLTDTNGCTSTDSTAVFVEIVETIGVPNAFSPNGNGNNDELYVEGVGIESMTFQIFNRYGQKVFETSDQQQGWDGTFNGKELNPGVFTYVLRYKFYSKDTESLTGTITLIK